MSVSKLPETDGKAAPDSASDVFLCQFIGYRMKRASLMIQDDMAKTLAPFGLRIGTFSALAVVAASPGISQNDLSEVLKIKRSGVVALIDELEGMGILKRNIVKSDRRTNALTVTAKGQRLWTNAEQAVCDHEANLFSDLGPDEITQLHDLLARVSSDKRADLETKA